VSDAENRHKAYLYNQLHEFGFVSTHFFWCGIGFVVNLRGGVFLGLAVNSDLSFHNNHDFIPDIIIYKYCRASKQH
jgi:hypothetical protein